MAGKHYDLIVIGGGPGGYVGAIRAAQLGMKVACVERNKLGGVCLNWGCIPSKSLLANAEVYEKCHHEADEWGLEFQRLKVNWEKVVARSRGVAAKLEKGVGFLLKKNKIDHIQGHAKIVRARTGAEPCAVEVYDCTVEDHLTTAPATIADTPRETITATNVLIATGAKARDLPFARFDGERIIGAREAMTLKERPESLLIVGAGAIGMEFGYFYHTFGAKVTVVEMAPRVLPVEDDDICAQLQKLYTKKGMDIRVSTTVTAVEKTDKGVKATLAPMTAEGPDESKAQTVEAEKVLLAIGVRGLHEGVFDESVGIRVERDSIVTDYAPPAVGQDAARPLTYQTTAPGVYAIGDVIGPPWLAHVASEEAITCVERLAGHDPIPIDYSVVPGCTYCHPQVASVGFTERALQEAGLKKGEHYEVGAFSLQSHGKAIATNANVGLVKIIRGLPRGEILGAHILADQATELIAEMGLARRLEATTEEIIVTIHAHPTMHEALREAALASEGRVIHA